MPVRSRDDVGGVCRSRDPAPVAQHDDVGTDLCGRRRPARDPLDTFVEGQGRRPADGAAGREPDVADEDVGTGGRHRPRVVLAEDVRRREQVERGGRPDEIDLELVAHAGLLEVLAEHAVDEANRREVLDARDPQPAQVLEERLGLEERIGAVHAGEDRGVADGRDHLGGHVANDLVRVAVREEPRERAAAGHPVAARVVDHQEVDAPVLLGCRRQAVAGAAAEDGLAAIDLATQPGDDVGSRLHGASVHRHPPLTRCDTARSRPDRARCRARVHRAPGPRRCR